MTTAEPTTPTTFDQLGLAEPLLRAVTDVGYEVPTPIQARTIPALLQGRDLIGQAQTGTGKTAAFALPLLRPSILRWTGCRPWSWPPLASWPCKWPKRCTPTAAT